MSLYAALFGGVSGLQAYSGALGIISDNITNINTFGYKEARARFSTLVSESSATAGYSPGGVRLSTQSLISQQGLLQTSSSATDLGIDGSGFFVVRKATEAEDLSGEILFTRAGSFSPDSEGFLKNTAGLYLMGWELDSTGALPANLQDLGQLVPIQTTEFTGEAEPTTEVSLQGNLSTNQVVNPAIGSYVAGGPNNMASGNFPTDFETSISVVDAQGATHSVFIGAVKAATNLWNVEVWVDPAGDVSEPDGQLAAGQLAFNGDGELDVANSTPSLFTTYEANWQNGASRSFIDFDWGTDGSTDGLAQFGDVSNLLSFSADGAQFGAVTGLSIGNDGTVTALFDNGLTRDVYQLPFATFQNPDGLARRQGNAYSASNTSGSATIQQAGSGGAGTVAANTLEASTVDLANEFANLITTQRAFSASTRIITTADEMLTELNNVKR